MKNHAFLMPVHKQPSLVARIIREQQAPNHHFFVHVSGQVNNYVEFVSACKDLNNVYFVDRIPVYHCGVSQVYATLILLEAAKKHSAHFDYIHHTSGQDYPLRSVKQFDEFFEHTDESFMCFNYEKSMDYWRKIYNWHVYMYHSNGDDSWFDKLIIKIGNTKIGSKILRRWHIDHLAGSWDWYSWSDKVVDFVDKEIHKNMIFGKSLLLRRFNYTCGAGEHIFATILYPYLEELKIRKHYPLHFVSWNPRREVGTTYRPYNLNELDYELVINSQAFWCRKVDEIESAKLLDMIDAQRGNDYIITEHDYFL